MLVYQRVYIPIWIPPFPPQQNQPAHLRPNERHCDLTEARDLRKVTGRGNFAPDESSSCDFKLENDDKPWLVGGFNQPLWKMMEWITVGVILFPIYGKITQMFQTTRWYSGKFAAFPPNGPEHPIFWHLHLDLASWEEMPTSRSIIDTISRARSWIRHI